MDNKQVISKRSFLMLQKTVASKKSKCNRQLDFESIPEVSNSKQLETKKVRNELHFF